MRETKERICDFSLFNVDVACDWKYKILYSIIYMFCELKLTLPLILHRMSIHFTLNFALMSYASLLNLSI
jgi:hypothetical protein